MTMSRSCAGSCPLVATTILAACWLALGACQSSSQPRTGDTVPDGGADLASGDVPGAADDAAAPDVPAGPVEVTLSESTYTFATPDLSHGLIATVTGTATSTVTWSTSNSYIATVSATGVVTSVSGGDAIITATSTADPSKSATGNVTIAEPQRMRATSYVD